MKTNFILENGKWFYTELPERPELGWIAHDDPNQKRKLDMQRDYYGAHKSAIANKVLLEDQEHAYQIIERAHLLYTSSLDPKENHPYTVDVNVRVEDYQSCTDPGMENLCAEKSEDCPNVENGSCQLRKIAIILE